MIFFIIDIKIQQAAPPPPKPDHIMASISRPVDDCFDTWIQSRHIAAAR
jgi:hypothetical protein